MYCLWYICLTSMVLCLFVLNQRRGLLMFSLPFLFYTFLWGLPCEKGRILLLEMHQQTWTTVFQKCQPLNWRLFWPFSPLSIPLLGILPLECDRLKFRQALTSIHRKMLACRHLGAIVFTGHLSRLFLFLVKYHDGNILSSVNCKLSGKKIFVLERNWFKVPQTILMWEACVFLLLCAIES